jgi:hypothetical protein
MDDPYALIPELGDLVTIVSNIPDKTTTGRIVFRDESLIRLKSLYANDRGIDFPLDPETGEFLPEMEVTMLKIHEKNQTPYFSLQLQVQEGALLDFYGLDGTRVADSGIVQEVIATAEEDAILLTDGRLLKFDFLGPPPPIAIVVPGIVEQEEVLPMEEEEPIPVFDESLISAPMVEEIPSFERTYNDAIQRDSMYNSFLEDIPAKQQKNPRVLQTINRRTDVLMALKNSILVRNEDGVILIDKERSYEANTIRESLQRQPYQEPLSALLPVAAVKKVIYTDDAEQIEGREGVEVRPDIFSIASAYASEQKYMTNNQPQGNPFLSYMDTLLSSTLPAFVPSINDTHIPKITIDQDVLRTEIPPTAVEGLESGLPAYEPVKKSARGVDAHKDYITVDHIGTITDRVTRLIGATTFKDPQTGKQTRIAPADTGATKAYIFLSPEIAKYRLPTRSSVLLWDIQASEISRKRTQTFYTTMMSMWADQKVLPTEGAEDFFLAEELKERIGPITSIVCQPVMEVLDSFGLQKLDINEPILTALVEALETGRKEWDTSMGQLRQRALTRLKEESKPLLDTVSDSPLWSQDVWTHPEMASALADIQQRETAIGETMSARTAFLMSQYTLRNTWYTLVAKANQAAMDTAVKTYVAERRRIEYNTQTQRQLAALLAAKPVINNCQHVKELETVMNIREDGKRMGLLQKFIDKYQAGQQDNWYVCGLCEEHLICRHEVLLLNEHKHPGRGDALHKALLLEYSGPVFEGSYICKNCGQKISDLEYDTSMEYDDDGKPMVGRTVIEEDTEEVVLDEKEEVVNVFNLREGHKYYMPYILARTVFEYCGIQAPNETYMRVIRSFLAYFHPKNTLMPQKDAYNGIRDKALKAKAKDPKVQVPIPYETYLPTQQVSVVGALVLLEILTSDIAVPFPASGCTFVRGGKPLDSEGDGTLSYVTCVLAGMIRNDFPWNGTTWSANRDIKQRLTSVRTSLEATLSKLLCIPHPVTKKTTPAIDGITAVYQQLLQSRQDSLSGRSEDQFRDLQSSTDQLPLQFRPAPYIQPVEETAIQNVGKFQQAVATGPVDQLLEDIKAKQMASIQTVLQEFHTVAKASAGAPHISARSDSNCCFKRLGAIAIQGYGIQSLRTEMGDPMLDGALLLEEGAHIIQTRDPAKSANGSHFMVPWSAPNTTEVLPKADPSMYYLLFLKHCAKGNQYGSIHEFGDDDACRHCEFKLPQEFADLVPAEIPQHFGAKQFEMALADQRTLRKEKALEAFEKQGIRIDEETFHLLEDAIHSKKSVHSWVPPVDPTFQEKRGIFLQLLKEATFLPTANQQWELLESAYTVIENREGGRNFNRLRAFRPFEETYESLRASVLKQMKDLYGARPTADQRIQMEKAEKALMDATEECMGAEGARNMMNAFVVSGIQLATGTANDIQPYTKKWFASMTESHKSTLIGIWTDRNTLVEEKSKEMFLFKHEESQQLVKSSLLLVMKWLGSWLHQWIALMRVGSMTEQEMRIVLRWILFHVLQSLLAESSPLYATVHAEIRSEVIQFLHDWCVKTLRIIGIQKTKYQISSEAIKEALKAREEKERNLFIQEIDKLERGDQKLELMKKKLGIGRWAIGGQKGLFSTYNAAFNEFLFAQRREMGIPDFSADITGIAKAQPENRYGLRETGGREAGYDVMAPQIEDA